VPEFQQVQLLLDYSFAARVSTVHHMHDDGLNLQLASSSSSSSSRWRSATEEGPVTRTVGVPK